MRRSELPRSLVVVVAIYLVLGLLYLRVVPPLEGYDSVAHHNYVNYLRKEHQLPRIDAAALTFSYELVQQPPLYYLASALASGLLPYDRADEYTRRSLNAYFVEGLSTRWSVTLPDAPPSHGASILLARLVSLLGGLMAVVATWFWVRALLPERQLLATAAAALVGFNPVYLFVSTTVTNDAWAVAGAAVTMWLVTSAAHQERFSLARWFLVGCVAGLAVLTKYSVLLVAVPAAFWLVVEFKRIGYRKLVSVLALLLAGGMLTAGFWYIRNLVIYGEIVPMGKVASVVLSFRRSVPVPLSDVVAKLPALFRAYWGVFVSAFAPEPFYLFWQWVVLVGCVGLGVFLVAARERSRWLVVAVGGLWFLAAFAGLVNWMRWIAFGDQVRLLLVASPAIALLLLLGWNALVPRRWQGVMNGCFVLVFALVSLWPLRAIVQTYAMPAPLSGEVRPGQTLNARVENGLTVLGYDLPGGATVFPGRAVPLTLYFRAERAIPEDYTLFIHLVTDDNTLLYQFDGVPVGGRHPTRQWRPGEAFADPYSISIRGASAPGTLAHLELGFYRIGDPNGRLPIYDPSGNPVGDRLVLGRVRVLADAPTLTPANGSGLATWNNQVCLLSARIDEDAAARSYLVTLEWQARSAIANDLVVFVQLLDGENRVVGQIDQQPHGGRTPTSTWLPGETITDTYRLAIPEARWQRMIAGLYDGRTGQRHALLMPAKGQDFFVLRSTEGAQ